MYWNYSWRLYFRFVVCRALWWKMHDVSWKIGLHNTKQWCFQCHSSTSKTDRLNVGKDDNVTTSRVWRCSLCLYRLLFIKWISFFFALSLFSAIVAVVVDVVLVVIVVVVVAIVFCPFLFLFSSSLHSVARTQKILHNIVSSGIISFQTLLMENLVELSSLHPCKYSCFFFLCKGNGKP